MKVLFKAVLIYGIASAVVAWFGLLFITIANLVFAFARSISMGVNIFQNFAAGIILILLTILLFFGMKLLFGVAKAGMAMGKAMASAGKMGMPPGGMGNMLKGLGKLDPRSLRDAGNLANKLGGRKAGNLLNKGANMKSGLDEARELKALAGDKNTGKIDKKKKKELEKSRSKRVADLDKASKDKKFRDETKAGMLLDEDGNKKTGEELREAEKEARKFDEDAQRVAKFREMFPELGERLDSDQISSLIDGEMPNYEKRRLGIGDDEMNNITARAEKGHFTDGLGVNTDNHYKKLAEEIGGIGEEHKDVVATDSKDIQEKNSETRENDEKATSTADSLKDAHSSEVKANESLAGEDIAQKALNVSQTVNETKNATLNGSDNSNSPEAVISPDKEREIASGANDLPVDKSTAEDNARRTSVEIGNLTSSAPGMPEGTTLDENGDSLRSSLLNRDAEGNVISSMEDDEIVRSGETAARGDAIHGTVLPKEVTDSGDYSEENIAKATSSATQDYVNGMEDKAVADSLTEKDLLGSTSASDSDNVSEYTGEKTGQTVGAKNNVEEIISPETTSTASSDDYMATLEDAERETVSANRNASTDTQFAENMSTERPMDVRDDQTSSVNDVIGEPVSGSATSGSNSTRTTDTNNVESFTEGTNNVGMENNDVLSSLEDNQGEPVQATSGTNDAVQSAFQNLQKVREQYEQESREGRGYTGDSTGWNNTEPRNETNDTVTPTGQSESFGQPSADNLVGAGSSSNQDYVESANDQGTSNVDQFISGTSFNQENNANVPNVDQFIGNTPNEENAVPVSNQQSQSAPNVDQNTQQSQGVPSVDQFITDTSTQDTAAASNTDQFVGSDSARNQETTTPVSQVNNASNVNQSAQPVSDAQQDSTPVEQSNNVEAPVVNQATAAVSNQSVDATTNDKFTDAGASIPFTQDSSNITGQNTEQPVQSENNVSQFTEPQSAPGVSNQDIFGAVNQETPDYVERPTQAQPQQAQSAPVEPQKSNDQVYGERPVQDRNYQDRPAPAQFVEDTQQPSGMNQDQFSASGQQYSEQGYSNAPQQNQNYQDRPAPAQQAPMSADPQQYMDNGSTQQPSNDDIMNSLVGEPQPQPTRETPVTPVNYVNGQADNAQPMSGDYGNIPFVGDNGLYGDRDVKLSPESLALMGMMMGEKENRRDSDLRRDINDMNRRTENRMMDRMDKMSEKFAEDLRESGKYTEEEITNELDKVENALRESMKRTDSFLEDLDKSKSDGNLTNQGNTGKVKRPKKD